jgi:predicted O-methyltransferase YrrM
MELSFGQRLDDSGLVQSWFTHGALDAIIKMDLSGKNILQFGSGMGDVWLAKRCKTLLCVERKEEWLIASQQSALMNGIDNIQYFHRPCNDSSGMADFYTEIPYDDIDVIINDDAYRYEVCVLAIDYFKKRGGGILIVDNWMQDYVFLSPKSEEILMPFRHEIYPQLDHRDHEGNCWKTAIFYIK